MDKESRDLLHKYFIMQDADLTGMSLQELFDYRFEYIQLHDKLQRKFEELDKLK